MKIQLPKDVKKIIEILEENGYEAYAVGGCVRDSLLGLNPKDWDITTSAKPWEVKQLFFHTIDTGIEHGTVTVMLNHVGYEVTTYRIDGEYEDGRHPKEVEFTSNLIEDLKRRDFTINAMAYSDRTGVVDAFDGIADLKDKRICCVGVAKERFTEDALRILRAIRFSAKLGFEIEAQTAEAIKELTPMLLKISRERIQAELDKMILSDYPDRVILLANYGILPYIFAECKCESEQYSLHQEDTPKQVIDRILKSNVLCEKTRMESLAEKLTQAKKDHFIRWAIVITYLPYEDVLKSLKFDNKTIKICQKLRDFCDEALQADASYIRHLAVNIGVDIFSDYYLEYRRSLGNVSIEVLNQIAEEYTRIVANKDCLSLKELQINGTDLQQQGLAKGKQIGEVLNDLFDKVLTDASLNQKEILQKMAMEIKNLKNL